MTTCPAHPDGCPGGGKACWVTAELVPACRCLAAHVHADHLEPGTGELLECLDCGKFERIYRTIDGGLTRGLLATMLELKEKDGITVPAVADWGTEPL